MVARELSDQAWRWVWKDARSLSDDHQRLAFLILATLDCRRFGQELAESDWSWDRDKPPQESHYASIALVEATKEEPRFMQSRRDSLRGYCSAVCAIGGSKPDETKFAVDLLRVILSDSPTLDVASGELEVRVTDRSGPSFAIRYVGSTSSEASQSVLDEKALDTMQEDHRERQIRLSEYLKQARRGGGDLLLARICCDEIEATLGRERVHVDELLDGLDVLSPRSPGVQRAEYLFVALCEALLKTDPERGVSLWLALRTVLAVRYVGPSNVDELLHMAFRVPDSEPVSRLRARLLDLEQCNTDKELLNIALAACYQNRQDWLRERIEEDCKSSCVWHQRRGTSFLSSFNVGNKLPVSEAWPDGPINSDTNHLRYQCAVRQWREACSQHWWNEFISAETESAAYGAWILFVKSADRPRVHVASTT